MRVSVLAVAASFALALTAFPGRASAQGAGDFVFTDDEGHLILRYVGTDSGHLDAHQFDEVGNVELSTMVHDRLRADTIFETEPIDAKWSKPTATRIARHLRHAAPQFSDVHVECRSASCRLVLQQRAATWSVQAHRELMGRTQQVVQKFIEANPATFEPVFLMAGQYQEPDRPYMKLFLRRAIDRK